MVTENRCCTDGDVCERFCSIISISADFIFDYQLSEGCFRLFRNINDDFSEVVATDSDFEQIIKDKGLVYPDDMESFECMCDNIRSGNDRVAFEIRFCDSSEGEFQWYRIKMKSEADENKHITKIIGKLENISDIKNAEKQLVDKAERDSLTKVYNKSTTKKLIKNYLRTDTRETYDALIIIDVDDFKAVNDTLGHMFGDSILVDLSQEMQDLFRSNDVVGRIGGDEFIVFLRGMKNKVHIESKANDICKIFDLLYAGDDGAKITGSLGISLFPEDGDTFDELYRKADLALYASKRAGKSCYTFYNAEYEEKQETSLLPRVEHYKRNMNFLYSNSDFDISILETAFSFSDSNDENEVYDLLCKIGKHFNLSRVSVLEYFNDENIYKIVEQWTGRYTPPTIHEFFEPSARVVQKTRVDFDDNGIFTFEHTKKDMNRHEEFLFSHGVKSCLSCGYFKNGRLMGFVSFEECVSTRAWSIEEAKSAMATAKVIFLHYFKIRDLK